MYPQDRALPILGGGALVWVSLIPGPCGQGLPEEWSHPEDIPLGCDCPAGAILRKRGQSLPCFPWWKCPASPSSGCGTQKRETFCFFLTEIALAELDRITLMKQTVLKFAAIIGPVFTTQLLAHILPTCIRQQMNYLLDVLVGDNIIKWLKNTGVPRDVQDAREGPATSQQAGSGKWWQ